MSRPRSRSRGRDRDGGQVKISIRNIDPHTDEQDLEELFKKYGELEDIYVPRDELNVCNRGYAFVTFMETEDAEAALVEDCTLLRGQRVAVAFAHRRPGNMRPPRSYVPSRDGPGGLLREWVARMFRKRDQKLEHRTLPYHRSSSRRRNRRRSWRSPSGERSRDQRDGRRRSHSRYRGSKNWDERSHSRRRRSRHLSKEKSFRGSRSLSPGGGYKRSRSRSRAWAKREYRSRSRVRVEKEYRSRSWNRTNHFTNGKITVQ